MKRFRRALGLVGLAIVLGATAAVVGTLLRSAADHPPRVGQIVEAARQIRDMFGDMGCGE